DWNLIQEYVADGAHPGMECAEKILNEYLDHIRIENCEYREDVVNSMLRRAPLRIAAPYYGYRGSGVDHYAVRRVSDYGGVEGMLRASNGISFGFAYPS